MADHNIPYMNAYGNIKRTLDAIKNAQTPERFTQDFLATKLNLKGGSPKPVIPFLKRIGFLNSDGSPTELYKQFRNPNFTGTAAATATRRGFEALYSINEYAHELKDAELRGIIIQATGADKDSAIVKSIQGSFRALAAFGDFDSSVEDHKLPAESHGSDQGDVHDSNGQETPIDLRLAYTINLNLPATSDVAVFNAIFKSLRENLLR